MKNDSKPPVIDELTKDLLLKCEVSSLKELYLKWLQKNDHFVPIKKISSFHDNFTEEKIINDVSQMDEFVIVSLYDYFRTRNGDKDIAKEKYMIDHVGLLKLIRSLSKRQFFEKSTPVTHILDKLGMEEASDAQKMVFVNLLKKAVKDQRLHARLVQHDASELKDSTLKDASYDALDLMIYSKISQPQYKKNLIYLILTVSAIIIMVSVFLPFLSMLNLS